MVRSFCLLLVVSAVPACGYLSDRAKDAGDIVILGVSTGSGLAVSAVPTRFLNLEVGGRKDESFWGARSRRVRWVESSYGIPFSPFWSPRLGELPSEAWTLTDVLKTSQAKTAYPEKGTVGSIEAARATERRYHLFVLTGRDNARLTDEFDVAVDASVLICGITVGVSLGEFVDFLGGLFTLDPAGDDDSVVEEPAGEEGGTEASPSAAPAG